MDFQRLFLFIIFSFSVLLLWDGWQRAQHPLSQSPVAVAAASAVGAAPVSTQNLNTAGVATITTQQRPKSGQNIFVKTDWLLAEINTVGGDIRQLRLLKHFDAKDRNKPFVLLQDRPDHTYIAQTGLLGDGLPTHNAVFTPDANQYQLTEGKDTVEVRLHAVDAGGAKVTKIYIFHRASYLIDVNYEIENTGTAPLTASAYFQLVRDTTTPEGGSCTSTKTPSP